jgi:hypothetical protein
MATPAEPAAPRWEPTPLPDESPVGVDRTLIRWMLSLTPDQRLAALQAFVDSVSALRDALATQSPVRLKIPHDGHWYVTVDLQGLKGTVKSSARILPGPLPPLREVPLSSIPSLVQHDPPPGSVPRGSLVRDYDVFISHASEDKDDIVRPLAHALSDGGLTVWYDEFELRIGDSLRRKIDMGLAKSRFGVVVLSRSFFGKGWANYELDGLVTRAVSGEQILLPIWHEITKQELISYSPSLADKVARSTGTHTVQEIAAEIIGVIRDE